MTVLIATILLLALAGLVNGGMDVITYCPQEFSFQTDWWLKKGRFAWHMLKFLNIISYVVAIIIQSKQTDFNITIILLKILIAYTIVGSFFELGYKFLWRK